MPGRTGRRPAKRTAPDLPDLPDRLDAGPADVTDGQLCDGLRIDETCMIPDRVADLELVDCVLDGVDLSDRTLTGLRGRDVQFDNCDLAGALLDGAQLTRVRFVGCRLTGLFLGKAQLADVVLEDCAGDLANFRATTATYLLAERCGLAEADFTEMRLATSALLDCDLRKTNFAGTRAGGLGLNGSRLDGLRGAAALTGVRIDAEQVITLGAALVAELGVEISPRP